MGIFFIVLLLLSVGLADDCTLRLYEATGDKNPGSNGFSMEIAGHSDKDDAAPSGYIPGKTYKSGFYFL